jgi:hypothetical protein
MPKLEQTANIAVGLRLKVDERQDLIAQRDRIIQEIASLSDEISTTMAMADEKQVRVGPWLLTLVENSGRLTLDKHRLLELGVPPETLTAATVRGQPSISLQVRTAAEE